MILIDKRLIEDTNLISHCAVCNIQMRKGREKEHGWQICRYKGKTYNQINIPDDDDDYLWTCSRCIQEFHCKQDEETKLQLEKYKQSKPGRPPKNKSVSKTKK